MMGNSDDVREVRGEDGVRAAADERGGVRGAGDARRAGAVRAAARVGDQEDVLLLQQEAVVAGARARRRRRRGDPGARRGVRPGHLRPGRLQARHLLRHALRECEDFHLHLSFFPLFFFSHRQKKKIGKRKNLLLSFPLSLDLFILRPVKKLQTLVCSMWFLAGVLTSPWFFLFSFYFRKVLIWNYCRIAVMFFCNLCCCFGLSSSKGRASLSLCILVFLLQEDRDNILRARKSGKGVLTAPFKLLNNRLGVILTYTVYKYELPAYARPHERIQAAIG